MILPPPISKPTYTCFPYTTLFRTNLRRQLADCLQRSSLKRLGILYHSTCVGFGYGHMVGYFLEPLNLRANPIRPDHPRDPSHPPGRGILTPFPSTTP